MSRLRAILTSVLLGGTIIAFPAGPALAADCSPISEEAELDHTPWGQERMNAERVWPLTRGEGVTVAVIDSGVSEAHPVLDGKVEYGADHVEPEEEGDSKVGADCDLVGHGTSIAGIIAGRDDPDSPFSGMAPEADIMSIRVLPDLGTSGDRELPNTLAKAIREAVDDGADVINLSVQIVHSNKLQKAVEYAAKEGAILVAAAGNQGGEDGDNAPQFPAAYDHDAMLAVAAHGPEGAKTESSNAGEYIDLAAPGESIAGPGPLGEGFTGGESATGTSFSAAFVSGTAALTKARFPDLTPEEIANRMRATAQSPPHLYDEVVGYGTVDPYRAVTANLAKDVKPEVKPAPALTLQADEQVGPRQAALILLGVSIAITIMVACGRIVIPIVWRKRGRRRAAAAARLRRAT